MGNNTSSPSSNLTDENLVKAVCRIECTHRKPDFNAPWEDEDSSKSQGSGFVIADPRNPTAARLVITNAHCIDFAASIRVQRYHSDDKAPAKLVRLNRDCDLAILAVEEEGFWLTESKASKEGSDGKGEMILCPAFELGGMPELQAEVRVVGYPFLGTELCVTKGVVSRIQLQTYCHSGIDMLACQTDGILNAGNSGGPVINSKNEVVGIAFQGHYNLGEFIPTCVFERFLDVGADHKDGEVVSVAGIPFSWQLLKNKAMISSLKLGDETGIYVTRVGFGAVSEKLEVGDVIVCIDGNDIGNFGTFMMDSNRVGFDHLITSRASGDVIQVGIVRDGERLNIELTLESEGKYRLVPEHDGITAEGGKPDFLVVGGLVFVALSETCSVDIGNGRRKSITLHMDEQSLYSVKHNADEELVVVSKMLPNLVTEGYEDVTACLVAALNGKRINSLREMAREVENCTEDYLKIQFATPCGECTSLVVMDRKQMVDEEEKLFRDYRIPFRSRIDGVPSQSPPLAKVEAGTGKEKTNANETSSLVSDCSAELVKT